MDSVNPLLKTTPAVEHLQLNLPGYALHYFASGTPGNELIIFLHAAFTDHCCFDGQITFFSSLYRVITLDMPGHGLSQTGSSLDTINNTIYHIKTIMELEGYEKVHLVGLSVGALIAQHFGVHFPNRVQSMTILGGYSIYAHSKELNRARRKENFKWIFKVLFSMNSFRRYVARVSAFNSTQQEKIYRMTQSFTRRSFMVMSGLGKALQPGDSIHRTYPLLLITGDKDLELSQTINKKWHQSEPQSQFVTIKDAGHCANMDNPYEFNALLMEFLSAVNK